MLPNKLKKRLLVFALILIISFLLLNYLFKHFSEFYQLISQMDPWITFLVGMIFVFIFFLNGLILIRLLYPFKIKLNVLEAFLISAATNFYNLIAPLKGGFAFRAVYLKKRYGLKYSQFILSLSSMYIVIFLAGSLLGLLSIELIWIKYHLFSGVIFSIFLGLFLLTLFFLVVPGRFQGIKNNKLKKLIKITSFTKLPYSFRSLAFLLFNSGFQVILWAVNVQLCFFALGIDIGFSKSLFIASLSFISIFISVTPGNLGVGDAVNVFSASLVGAGLTEAVAAAVILRAINVITTFILGPLASYFLAKSSRFKSSIKN
jgi:uncharacterized membrane protein YbhN (UPF0104 family)